MATACPREGENNPIQRKLDYCEKERDEWMRKDRWNDHERIWKHSLGDTGIGTDSKGQEESDDEAYQKTQEVINARKQKEKADLQKYVEELKQGWN